MGGRAWKPEDIAYLENRWGTTPTITMAKHLKRTIASIVKQAQRLGLGYKDAWEGKLTPGQIYKAFHKGVSPGTRALAYFMKKGIPFEIHYLGKKDSEKITYLVDIDKFWKWYETHTDSLDIMKLERYALGAEPKWVDEYRKAKWYEYYNRRYTDV